jgi:hypothetical protein
VKSLISRIEDIYCKLLSCFSRRFLSKIQTRESGKIGLPGITILNKKNKQKNSVIENCFFIIFYLLFYLPSK